MNSAFHHDSSREERQRKVAKMTYTPNMSADEIVLGTFAKKDRGSSAPLFPMLQRPASQHRQYQYQMRHKLTVPKPPKPLLPNAAPPYFPGAEGVPQPPVESPRSVERVNQRKATIDRIHTEAHVPANLKPLLSTFAVFMDADGTVGSIAFRHCMAELGMRVTKEELASRARELEPGHPVQELFSIFDVHKRGSVRVSEVLLACDGAINGPEKDRVRRVCFDLFDHDGRGCIHKAHLDELKFLKMGIERDDERTASMVKVLADLFSEELRIEEDQYIEAMFKGKGKKKKAPPLKPMQKSLIPVGRMRVSHIDFPRFCEYMDNHSELATAFAPCWLKLLITDGALRHKAVMSAIEGMRNTLAAEEEERDRTSPQ